MTESQQIELKETWRDEYLKTVVVWNHGDLPPQLNIEKLKTEHASYPRNPLVADIFYRSGAIEAFGRGMATVMELVREANLPAQQLRQTALLHSHFIEKKSRKMS
jgi:predicted HTH transcriptional regulator